MFSKFRSVFNHANNRSKPDASIPDSPSIDSDEFTFQMNFTYSSIPKTKDLKEREFQEKLSSQYGSKKKPNIKML